MFIHPNINPIAFSIGPLKVHWYGLMYLLGFTSAWLLGNYRCQKKSFCLTKDQFSDLLFYCALGVVVGGRLGYMLFYAWPQFVAQPLSLFEIWQGGMSFHGGMLGVIAAIAIYAFASKKSFFALTDFIVPLVPIGLGAGRVGNFINGELWGRVTHVPWAMIYPNVDQQPRHPSEIYEFLLEGVVLFIILWWFSNKPKPKMAVSALFLIAYGSFRFFLEFFRQPDIQKGFVAFGWMTMGQLLSLPMIILGIILMIIAYVRRA